MVSITRSKPSKPKPPTSIGKVDPSKIYLVWETHLTIDDDVIREGDRVRGSDPDVAINPQWFLPDGSTTADVNAARQRMAAWRIERLEASEARAERAPRATPSAPRVVRGPGQIVG